MHRSATHTETPHEYLTIHQQTRVSPPHDQIESSKISPCPAEEIFQRLTIPAPQISRPFYDAHQAARTTMSATLTRQLRASTPLMRAGPPIASASRIPLPPRLSHISLSRSIPISQSFHTSSARLTSPPRPAYRSLHISAPTERAPPVAHVGLANGNASTAGNSTGSQGAGNGTHGSGSGSGSAAGAGQGQKKKSGHMVWYREIVPGKSILLALITEWMPQIE